VNNRTIIKSLFKNKNVFHFVWLIKLLEIAPNLIFKNIKKNTDSEGGWLIIFCNKVGNIIEFLTSDDGNNYNYGDMIGIWTTSNEDLLEEIRMKGTFLKGPTNFKYSNINHISQLKKSLDKFANLK